MPRLRVVSVASSMLCSLVAREGEPRTLGAEQRNVEQTEQSTALRLAKQLRHARVPP